VAGAGGALLSDDSDGGNSRP
jgi:hypothetical protein